MSFPQMLYSQISSDNVQLHSFVSVCLDVSAALDQDLWWKVHILTYKLCSMGGVSSVFLTI